MDANHASAQHLGQRQEEAGQGTSSLSADDFRAVEETRCLLRVPGLSQDLHEAAREPLDQGTRLEDLDW